MKQIDKVEAELSHLQGEMRKNANLREAMTSPIINRKVLAHSLKDASAKINYTTSTSNLLSLLAENGRMKKLDGVISAFKTIMAAHRGEVVCEVITAKPLEAGQKKSLEDALKVTTFMRFSIVSKEVITELMIWFYRNLSSPMRPSCCHLKLIHPSLVEWLFPLPTDMWI